jgi:hypothetical protein
MSERVKSIVISVVVVVFLFIGHWYWPKIRDSKGRVEGDVSLTATRLPGLSIPLPPFGVKETSTQWDSGAHQIHPMFMKVSWTISNPDFREIANYLPQMPAKLKGRVDRKVNGHDGETLVLDISDHEALVTNWFCPVDGRMITLMTALNMDEKEQKALHERVLDGSICHTEKPAVQQALFPAVKVPDTFKPSEADPNMKLWEGPNGEALAVTMGKRQQNFLKHPELIQGVFEQMLASDGATLTWDGPPQVAQSRANWKGMLKEGAELSKVSALAVYCPESDVSFIAFYAADSKMEDPNANVLDTVTCPAN